MALNGNFGSKSAFDTEAYEGSGEVAGGGGDEEPAGFIESIIEWREDFMDLSNVRSEIVEIGGDFGGNVESLGIFRHLK